MGFISIHPMFRSQNNRNAPTGLLQKSLSPPSKNGVKDFELMDVMEFQEQVPRPRGCGGSDVAQIQGVQRRDYYGNRRTAGAAAATIST
jgi:hypothetical protein